MTTIYLIRHAEAEGNLYRRIQGHWDGRITPRGRQQIAALALRFRDASIDALYASDLQRTQDTAMAIMAYHDVEMRRTPRLREIDMGVWEGRPWGDVEYEAPEQMYFFNHDPDRWDVPGCERFPAMQQRMASVLRDIAAENDGKTVAVVSHGMAIRGYLAHALGVQSSEINTLPHGDNTCVACVTYESGMPRVEFYNDNSHLPPELSTFRRQTWWKSKDADPGNLRFEPMRFPQDAEFYTRCYADAWTAAHGSEEGFVPSLYVHSARRHSHTPGAVMKVLSGDTVVGMIELDPHRAKKDNCGWVSFLYLKPEYRGRGWAVLLLGHAIWFCECRGRTGLRLHCAEDNTRALGFYARYGFRKIGEEQGVRSTLYLLEKPVESRGKV